MEPYRVSLVPSSTFGYLTSQASATSLPIQNCMYTWKPQTPTTSPLSSLLNPSKPARSELAMLIFVNLQIDRALTTSFEMASSDKPPAPYPVRGDDSTTPGKPMTIGQHVLDKGAEMMQSLKPVKQMSQHVCNFALYSHDPTRQMETHHYVHRLNLDFLQCAVYDSDDSHGRLIGVEYIVSDRIFEALPPEEQKLWHSHAYEIKAGLWINPRIPEMIGRPELENLAKTYGKFWCTWQVARGDRLPLGSPALMVSPQPVNLGHVKPELVTRRDDKYNISTEAIRLLMVEIGEPEWINPQADYWKNQGKGLAIDIKNTEMKTRAPFP